MLLYTDAKTIFTSDHRKEIPLLCGKYFAYTLLFLNFIILVAYPVGLIFFTTDFIWAFSVIYLIGQSLPLLLIMVSCVCIATCHFITSSFANICMGLIYIVSFLLLLLLSIGVISIWMIYSYTFYWELFLAVFLPACFSLLNAFACFLLSIIDIKRYRRRKTMKFYKKDLVVSMSKKIEDEDDIFDKKKSFKNFKNQRTTISPPPLKAEDSLNSFSRSNSPPSDSNPMNSIEISPIVMEDSIDISSSISPFLSKKDKSNSNAKLETTISSDELPGMLKINSLDSIDDVMPVNTIAVESSDSEDNNIEINPPSKRETNAQAYASFVRRSTQSNGLTLPQKLQNSASFKSLNTLNPQTTINIEENDSYTSRLQNSSKLSAPSLGSVSFRNGMPTTRTRAEEKEQKRIEFELKEAAGPAWEKFVKKEKKKGREPTWDNFQKYQHLEKTQSTKSIPNSTFANQSFAMFKKFAIGNSIPQPEMQILDELSVKYGIPIKTLNEQYTRLNKKYQGQVTRKNLKQALIMPKISRNLLNSIFKLAGRVNSESLSISEYMKVMMKLRNGPLSERLASAFEIFDYDGNKTLDMGEMRSIVHALSSNSASKSDEKAMTTRLFKHMDKKQMGSIDQASFISYTLKDQELLSLFVNMSRNVDFV